jgi:hypothetical protein
VVGHLSSKRIARVQTLVWHRERETDRQTEKEKGARKHEGRKELRLFKLNFSLRTQI